MATAVVVASVTAFWGLIVWFVKLILLERYQFMDKLGGEPLKNPYVLIRLDRLTGAVDAFNWAGWVRVAPHSGYLGTETPGRKHSFWWQVAKVGGGLTILCILVVAGVFAWEKYESRQQAKLEFRQQAEQKAALKAPRRLLLKVLCLTFPFVTTIHITVGLLLVKMVS